MRNVARSSLLAVMLALPFWLGCGSGDGPSVTDPTEPPVAQNGVIWGHVLGLPSGACLTGARVEIIDGPGKGRTVVQTQACDAWSDVAGFEFRNLTVGASVTLRATAEGWRTQERATVVSDGGSPFQFALLEVGEPVPVPPPGAPPGNLGFIWGHVIEQSGICIEGAVVEIIEGPGKGRNMVQETPCDAWSFGGYWFSDLPVDVPVKLRATRDGYRPAEGVTVARTSQFPFQFELVPER